MDAPAEYNELCPFCRTGPFKSLSGLLRHMKKKHSEEPDFEEKKRGVPKEPKTKCPRCGKDVANLSDHNKHCVQARPDVVKIKLFPMDPQRVPKDPQESSRKLPQKRSLDQLSSLEFLNSDKAKLQKTVQLSTVSAYVSASNEDVKAKLCGIGTSAVMGQQNHLNERYPSYLGGETHNKTEYDPRQELPALSRDESGAPSSPIVSDDKEVQVRTFKNPFYRSPSSDRNATEVSDI